MVIYFTRYVRKKSIKILRLYYDELIGKTEEREGKKVLMVDDYMLNKVLDKIKKQQKLKNLMILRFWLIRMINCQIILF